MAQKTNLQAMTAWIREATGSKIIEEDATKYAQSIIDSGFTSVEGLVRVGEDFDALIGDKVESVIHRRLIRSAIVSLAERAPPKAAPRKSVAHQAQRFALAKEEKNERYLNIDSVYDGTYLKDKRVLLIGASRGLGFKLLQQMVADGAKVIATCRSSTDELRASGAAQIIEKVDVQDLASLGTMAEQIEGTLDFVLHNAGYFSKEHDTLDQLFNEEALKQIDICGLGPLRVVSSLKKAGKLSGAKVAVITSQAGSVEWRATQNAGVGGDYGHHMSRAACNIGAALMAEELRGAAVPIVLLHPGFNRTEMTAKYKDIWEKEGAVEPEQGARRVLYEMGTISMEITGTFINCEDGLTIPW